ncbi:Amidophosphoribosyltransferase 2, chloroplastic [Capsicum annuum]|uniref:Amidophosphoribosyltransferase 2, chloroplastic n=1 Tax=Capsicum annuum TaxID=4072 RepID=A0A2G2Z9U9_CAPAN|nr:Amidophosphoribosyltransferase 2, chloroplastic [Capsicum annuum]
MRLVSLIDTIDDDVDVGVVTVKEMPGFKELIAIIMNLESIRIEEYDEMVKALHGIGSYNYAAKTLDIDLKNRTTVLPQPSIKEPSILELKALPSHLQSETWLDLIVLDLGDFDVILALHALQHHGQEGAGIICVNDNVHKSITGVGLVFDVFSELKLDRLPGDLAIRHVRYSTAGASMLKNVQPFVASYRFGSVGVAHKWNLVNYKQFCGELEENGLIFNTSSDTEVVLHLIALSKARPFLLRIVEACEKIKGAYFMMFATEDKLVAVRDPYGFRPLVIGRRSNGAIVFASKTCALDLIEATYEMDVLPGEIYFALPNSVVFGRFVYESRHSFREILATEAPVECDVVIAIPEHIYFALPNSLVHVLSGVALISFKAARVPKDKEHPYGHGKFETLGALGISGVLLATVGGIGWHASDILLVFWSAAPEVVNQSHLHMHEQLIRPNYNSR